MEGFFRLQQLQQGVNPAALPAAGASSIRIPAAGCDAQLQGAAQQSSLSSPARPSSTQAAPRISPGLRAGCVEHSVHEMSQLRGCLAAAAQASSTQPRQDFANAVAAVHALGGWGCEGWRLERHAIGGAGVGARAGRALALGRDARRRGAAGAGAAGGPYCGRPLVDLASDGDLAAIESGRGADAACRAAEDIARRSALWEVQWAAAAVMRLGPAAENSALPSAPHTTSWAVAAVHTQVRKKFGKAGWFDGVCTAVDDDDDCHILYDDGDTEQMPPRAMIALHVHWLHKHALAAAPSPQLLAAAPPPRKRGKRCCTVKLASASAKSRGGCTEEQAVAMALRISAQLARANEDSGKAPKAAGGAELGKRKRKNTRRSRSLLAKDALTKEEQAWLINEKCL